MCGKTDTVYTTLKPVWIFCVLLGIHCHQFSSKSKYFQISLKFFQKYIHGALVLACAILLMHIAQLLTAHLGATNIIQQADIYFRSLTNLLSMSATLLFGWRKQDHLIQAIKKIRKIETKLNTFSPNLSYKSVKMFIISQLGFALLLWTTHFGLYCNKYYDVEHYTVYISMWLIYFTPAKITFIHMIEFCTLLLILKQQLRVLNNALKAIRKNAKQTTDVDRLVVIKQIKKLHSDITQICREINNIFSIPLLMKFLSEFIMIFTTIHYFIAGYTLKSEIGRKTIVKYYLTMVMGHLPLYQMAVVMIVCEYIYNEHRITGKLLHLVRTSDHQDCAKAVVISITSKQLTDYILF